jgi:hypothetical protein
MPLGGATGWEEDILEGPHDGAPVGLNGVALTVGAFVLLGATVGLNGVPEPVGSAVIFGVAPEDGGVIGFREGVIDGTLVGAKDGLRVCAAGGSPK